MNLRKRISAALFQNRYYDYLEYRLKKFVHEVAQSIPNGATVLDVGAGEQQYKHFFNHTKYTAQDLGVGDGAWDYSQLDIVSEIYSIPVPDQSFDYILCTQVMEHLRYPDKAFAEFSRILKPGGKLFVTCPLAWKEHQIPHDFFRYTQFSLQSLGHDHGFSTVELRKVGGKFITLARLAIDTNIIFGIRNRWVRYALVMCLYPFDFLLGFCAYHLDFLDTKKDLTIQYECIFKKNI